MICFKCKSEMPLAKRWKEQGIEWAQWTCPKCPAPYNTETGKAPREFNAEDLDFDIYGIIGGI